MRDTQAWVIVETATISPIKLIVAKKINFMCGTKVAFHIIWYETFRDQVGR